MATMRTIIKTTLGGVSGNFTETIDVEGDGYAYHDPEVPAAKTGTLTTRTDDNTGTFTMTTGHGFTTSMKIDVFWSGGQRRDMTATVTGDSVVLDGGTGDVLPIATTSITAQNPTIVEVTIDGADCIGLAVATPKKGFVVFYDDAGTPAVITPAIYSISGTSGRRDVVG